jgi:hypothetical protein
MTTKPQKYHRILAIAPASRGFGYALLEGERLVNWGVTTVTEDKNSNCVKKVEVRILHDKPDLIVLEDTAAEGSRRHQRIRDLSQLLLALSLEHGIPVAWFRRDQVMRFFFGKDKGTKEEMAPRVTLHFPKELGAIVLPKRRPWMGQHYQMDMFDAVALAVVLRGYRQA